MTQPQPGLWKNEKHKTKKNEEKSMKLKAHLDRLAILTTQRAE